MNLADFSLKRPVTIIVATLAVVVLGLVSLPRLKLGFLPKMELPFIAVWMPYPNSIPSQVEKDVARPVEEIMATLGGVQEMRSFSDMDGAWVMVEFEFGKSVSVLRLEVQEKMEQVRSLLPADLEDYFIFTFDSNDIPIMVGRISATGMDLAQEYDLLERRVINPMRRVSGVGRVEVGGVSPKDITIYLHLDKLVEHSVNADRLFELLTANNIDLSLGRVYDRSQRVTVRSLGQFRSIDDVENLVVSPSGIRLKDVAEVIYGEPAPTFYRRLNGEPAVAFEIQKASGANIVDVSRRIHKVLEEIDRDPALEGLEVVLFFDQAEDIKGSLNGLLQSGLIGSAFAIMVLLFFLRRIQPTLIVSIAIPFSVTATLIYLYLSGRTLNVLSMMGLMLAVGMLVDNAIVVLESIFKRRENGEDSRKAAGSGAREVAMAVTASTLTSIIVFAPIILTGGNQLAVFLSEVGITISITLILSLLICLTLVPLLAARITVSGRREEFAVLKRLRRGYTRTLNWTAILHPKLTGILFIPLTILITVGAIKVTNFGPADMDEGGVKQNNLYVQIDFIDNVNVYGVREYVGEVEEFLLPHIDSLGIESLYTYYQDNYAAFGLFFKNPEDFGDKEIKDLRKWLRENLPVLAGTEYLFGNEDDAGRGAETLSITLFGEDSDLLEEISLEVQRRLTLIDDLEDVRGDSQSGKDEIRIALDRNQASRFGIDSRTISQVLGLTFRGVSIGEFQGEDREIELGIVLEPSDRRNIENLKQLPLSYRNGRPVLLGQVAKFEIGKGPNAIEREQQKTALNIRASYEGEDFRELTGRVEKLLNSMSFPAGYSWSFGRELRQQRAERDDMGINVLIAICCVYFVMAALFESFLHPLVIMLCIPFAGLGVVWTMMITRTPFNIMAMIGIVILIGIVVNNGIVLLDHVNALRKKGMPRSRAIIEGCTNRFRPILMTASTTILGLMPLAIGRAAVGDGYYYPLARAVMGGLAASTILTLIVLPTFYVLAEQAVAYLKKTWAWGMGRIPLPWRSAVAKEAE